MRNALLDTEFIKKLDSTNQRELYARIISLTTEELPIEEISGKIQQGSLNIDGTSAVRRSCSLTMVTQRVNINEYYWSFTTKFRLLIGLKVPDYLKNEYTQQTSATANSVTGEVSLTKEIIYIYEDYPDIIWFNQGIFVITDFKYIMNTMGTDNIYISGKDKMALLNGDMGGNLPHTTDVGTIEEIVYADDMTPLKSEKTPLTMKQIITEMVHKYGGEPFHNIVVNDLDDNMLVTLDYNGDNDIYLFKNVKSGLFENVVFDGDIVRYDKFNSPIVLSQMTSEQLDTLSTSMIKKEATRVKATTNLLDDTYYTVVKCSYGSIVGYKTTDWTYPSEGGELIINAGETITSALDKICDAFGDTYEYFYNIDGQFVFQRKMDYVNTSWNSLVNTWELNEVNELIKSTYAESSKLISQVKYSFVDGTLITSFNNSPNISNVKNDFAVWGKKTSKSTGKDNDIHMRIAIDEKPEIYTSFNGTTYTSDEWDWRELIYQMAQDYYDHNHDDDYEIVLHNNNPSFPFGKTGYEQYYEDILGFWRQLYNPKSDDNEVYILDNDNGKFWNRNVFQDPSALLFWFDFLDGRTTDLGKYSVKAIGDRTKVVNDDKIKAIYYGEIPNIIYINQQDYNNLKTANLLNDGYAYILLPEVMEEYFVNSKKLKSAQDELDQLIYQHAYCNESITITAIPVYHLEPNVRIGVYDNKAKINGEYILNKMTISLGYNGTMQIYASKAPVRLF